MLYDCCLSRSWAGLFFFENYFFANKNFIFLFSKLKYRHEATVSLFLYFGQETTEHWSRPSCLGASN